ncbi:MAG: hypothetical protein C0620_10695 [Desulfuromonas sp.]|nr:MAG: hypothetical protein C0620_10695 [Desulfuromonas sp.]
MSSASAKPLAIIGIGCLFPQAGSKEAYWANIKGGVDSISDVPETHWRLADLYDPDPKKPDHTYGKRGGFLDPVDFNPMEFSIQPNILEAIDTSQLLGLIAAREALRDAGYDPQSDFARDRVSVLLGVTGALEMVIPLGARLGHPQWRKALKDAGVPDDVAQDVVDRIADSYVPWQENSFPGLLGNVVAGRISKQFDLGGTNSVVDAACGSSLSAVHMAAMELACGRSDMVITGGIDTFNDIFMYTCFSKTPALSPSNIVRPFDHQSDGTLIGEGLGLIALKRLEDAERDNDHIYAVIRGVGAASDGKGGAIYEPSADGQKRTLIDAYRQSGIDPRTITLLEAHGTGTKVGDATEIRALREVYGESDGRPWCALGSVKSQIGHTKAAAGSAGLIKAALALYHKVLPPTINVEQPQEVITAGNSPFYVNTTTRPWLPHSDHPRRAAVSAFGFGGSNFHCVLEEYLSEHTSCDWSGAPLLFALCGDDRQALVAELSQLKTLSTDQLRRAAAKSRTAFNPQAKQRLLFVVESAGELSKILTQAEQLVNGGKTLAGTPNGLWYGQGGPDGKLAVLFPGQGAQYVHMLADLACHAPQLLQTLQDADDVLDLADGNLLSQVVYPHSLFSDQERQQADQQLQATQHAQPAIGTVSLGAWNYLSNHYGIAAEAFAGHSYGELTALCAAGCFASDDLFRLSHLRGQLMAGDGSDKGTMLAVSAPLADIEAMIRDENLCLVLANHNTPTQGVLSGEREEIARAQQLCQERGMRCTPLDVAAAFHSPLVAAASKPFYTALQEISLQSPKISVYANKTALPYPEDSGQVATLLAEQIANPVKFVRQIEQMYADGVRTFLEVGPGARLTGMVKKILADKSVETVALDASNGKRSGLTDLGRMLVQLGAIGYPLNLERWDGEFTKKIAQQPEPKPAKMTVTLTGANYVKEKPARPASQRRLVDADTLVTPPVATAPATSAPAQQASHEDVAALKSLQESMAVLQRMQEDTARLHQQFLEGQASAVDAMRALMDHQHPTTLSSPQPSRIITAPPATVAAQPVQPASITPVSPAVVSAPVAAAVTSSVDVQGALLDVVAEKTGYPKEMLELDMSLDADLGIDSIKRVEILSAMQEAVPGLPAVQPDQLGSLQTLRQIVDALGMKENAECSSCTCSDSTTETATTPSHGASDATIQRQVVEMVPVPAQRQPYALATDAPLWLVDDCSSLVPALATALKHEGYPVKIVSPSQTEVPDRLSGLVVIAPEIGSDSYFLRDAFSLVQRCAPALKRQSEQRSACLVTVSRLDGHCGFNSNHPLRDPLSGALAGLCKTASLEWPELTCKAIDLGDDLSEKEHSMALMEELLLTGPLEVGISRSERVTPALVKQALAETVQPLTLSADDIVVISGGARGVTAEVAEQLAVHGNPTLLLLGRSELPQPEPEWLAGARDEAEIKRALMTAAETPLKPRELNEQCGRILQQRELTANIQRLKQAGSKVIYKALDIRNESAVKAALDDVRSLGTIRGLIHGAGVLADRKIEDKTLEQFDQVYSTKIAGLQALLHASESDPLQFIVLFSSSTARFGRVGQVDYAMANEVLNKTAQALARQKSDCRVVSINWGPWDGGMVTAALKKMFAAEGIDVIDLTGGSRYLLEELNSGDQAVEIVILGGHGTPDKTIDAAPPVTTPSGQPAGMEIYPQEALTLQVSVAGMPVLKDHVIDGKAVVPMAMIVEWLAHAAMHLHPGMQFIGFDKLRINSGIRLAGDETCALELRGQAGRPDNDQLVVPIQIVSTASQAVHASGEIILSSFRNLTAPAVDPVAVDPAQAQSKQQIYTSGQLFHGPALQGLQAVQGESAQGIVGVSTSSPAPGSWMNTPLRYNWLAEPQVLDSSFHMMILWCYSEKQQGSLPMYAGSYRQYREGFDAAAVRIQCRIGKQSGQVISADIDFIDEHNGELIARLQDYQCTMIETLTQSFANNTLN